MKITWAFSLYRQGYTIDFREDSAIDFVPQFQRSPAARRLHQSWPYMNKVRVFSLVIICALTVAACSDSPASPTSPSSASAPSALTAELAGAWTLTSIQPSGGAVITTPADARYEVTFDGDRVSARVDCNVCAGAVSSSANVLTIGPALACTRAACPTMSYESQVTQLLGGDHAVTISGSSMTLTSSRGRLALTR